MRLDKQKKKQVNANQHKICVTNHFEERRVHWDKNNSFLPPEPALVQV